MNKKSTLRLRTIIPVAIVVLAAIAFAVHISMGTISALGWQDIALICPIGALLTMISTKTLLPKALISLALAIVGIIVLGRFFCGWLCPVPVWKRLRNAFSRKAAGYQTVEKGDVTELEDETVDGNVYCGRPSNARHFILGASILSAAIFGFPVFCLICPVGLTFALFFILFLLFSQGDVTWSCILIPVILILELVFFHKWCSHICPIGALLSIFSRFNKTFQPTINDADCLETGKGIRCGRCAEVCELRINPRHPQKGVPFYECIKCRRCVDSCPGNALFLPFLSKKASSTGTPIIEDSLQNTVSGDLK